MKEWPKCVAETLTVTDKSRRRIHFRRKVRLTHPSLQTLTEHLHTAQP